MLEVFGSPRLMVWGLLVVSTTIIGRAQVSNQTPNSTAGCQPPPSSATADSKIAYLQCRLLKDEKRISDLENSASGDDTDDKVEALTKQVAKLQEKLNDLASQLENLRTNPSKLNASVVKAPFEVVNASGHTLLRVVENDGMGELLVLSAGQQVAEIGPGTVGRVAFRAYGKGVLVAAMGDTGDGGSLNVLNASGQRVGFFNGFRGHGHATILSPSGSNAASLEEGDDGGGKLRLYDPGGSECVGAGWNGGGGEICAATAKRGTQCIDISVPLQMR